jgi:hypothetical protein
MCADLPLHGMHLSCKKGFALGLWPWLSANVAARQCPILYGLQCCAHTYFTTLICYLAGGAGCRRPPQPLAARKSMLRLVR